MHVYSLSTLLALMFVVAACSSPNTGQLVVGGDGGSMGDDDDSVGDDDDSVGDDDDSVGDDDDDGPASIFEGDWYGETSVFSEEEDFELCQGESYFGVSSDGSFQGGGECPIEGGPEGGGAFGFAWTGEFNNGGELIEGTVTLKRGDEVFEFALDGGVYEDSGIDYIYVWWEMSLGGGGGRPGFPVTGDAWGALDSGKGDG